MSLDAPMRGEHGAMSSLVDVLPGGVASPEEQAIANQEARRARAEVAALIEGMEPRELDILRRRWLNRHGEETLLSIAKRHRVSRQRVNQIEGETLRIIKVRAKARREMGLEARA